MVDLLRRRYLLREAKCVDGTEHGGIGRTLLRPQTEVLVKLLNPNGRSFHVIPGLVGSDALAIEVKAHHGTVVVAIHTPLFQEPQEVVETTIGSKVLGLASRLRKGNSLTGNQGHAISGGNRHTVSDVV